MQDNSDLHLHCDCDYGGVWRRHTQKQRWQGSGRSSVFYQCALHGHAHLAPGKCALAKAVAKGGLPGSRLSGDMKALELEISWPNL